MQEAQKIELNTETKDGINDQCNNEHTDGAVT